MPQLFSLFIVQYCIIAVFLYHQTAVSETLVRFIICDKFLTWQSPCFSCHIVSIITVGFPKWVGVKVVLEHCHIYTHLVPVSWVTFDKWGLETSRQNKCGGIQIYKYIFLFYLWILPMIMFKYVTSGNRFLFF